MKSFHMNWETFGRLLHKNITQVITEDTEFVAVLITWDWRQVPTWHPMYPSNSTPSFSTSFDLMLYAEDKFKQTVLIDKQYVRYKGMFIYHIPSKILEFMPNFPYNGKDITLEYAIKRLL